MRRPTFSERKAVEAVAHLLKKVEPRQLYLIHVLKLLYIADLEALQKWGRAITWDHYVSMDNGPVLSETYSLMTGCARGSGVWERHISDRVNDRIGLEEDIPPRDLSKAELDLLDNVFERFGRMDRCLLCDHTHTFPEWRNPSGSAYPISLEEILEAGGRTEDEIREIEADLDGLVRLEQALG